MTQLDVPTSNTIQVKCRVLRLNKSKGNLSTRHQLLAYQITNPNRSFEMVHQLRQRTGRRIQRNIVRRIISKRSRHFSKNTCTCPTRSWKRTIKLAADLSLQNTW